MSVQVPNLDDRRFQDLVDDAKKLVQQRCPEWTDHNVSDPGVTLIETFAYMVDQLFYRLNRVPDRNYLKFLELIGVRPFPPTAARVPVTFRLSAPQPESVRVPQGTQVATRQTDHEDAISFRTIEDLAIVATSMQHVATQRAGSSRQADKTADVSVDKGFDAFDKIPSPGDVFLIGLTQPVPSCVLRLVIQCDVARGHGPDPTDPPIVWEARCGAEWTACEVELDETGGLNKPGAVHLHVPTRHSAEIINKQRAGWIRCRVTEPEEGQPRYSDSPRLRSIAAMTIGGTVEASHSDLIVGELVGFSDGTHGQRFSLRGRPVVPSQEPVVLEVATEDGWEEWRPVENFADVGPAERHFMLDAVAGELVFGPAVRQPDGSLQSYGAVPPKGAALRVRSYATGGGRAGNVGRGEITILRSDTPYISAVENRRPAGGGVDGEDVDNLKVRGPIVMRTRNRAVTTEDFEHIAREAAPEVARIKAVPAGEGAEAGSVRVLVVPAAIDDELGRLRFEQLIPADETLSGISEYIDERRLIGSRVLIEPPVYQGVTVVARLMARSRARRERVEQEALAALYGHFHPIRGGADGKGWPFGRPIHVAEVYAVLQRLEGTELVEDAKLFAADPITGERGKAVQRLDIDRNALVFSYDHQVLVEG